MRNRVKRIDVEEAVEDLKNHTLAGLPGELAKLLYLASTRDYSTARYYHEGLALQFSEEIAQAALETCHREIFGRLTLSFLEDLTHQLDLFIHSTKAQPTKIYEVWKKLEPYRVLIPQDSDRVSSELFFSNIRIALGILETRQAENPHSLQSALRRQ